MISNMVSIHFGDKGGLTLKIATAQGTGCCQTPQLSSKLWQITRTVGQ